METVGQNIFQQPQRGHWRKDDLSSSIITKTLLNLHTKWMNRLVREIRTNSFGRDEDNGDSLVSANSGKSIDSKL